MGRHLRRLALALAVLTPAAAQPAQRISIGPVRGDRRAAISNQLALALCPARECVLWKEVSTRGRPDLAKARRLRVDGIVLGAVERRDGERVAVLGLLVDSVRPARSWVVPLRPEGLLAPQGVREISTALARLALEDVPPPAPSRPRAPARPGPEPPSAPPPETAAPSPPSVEVERPPPPRPRLRERTRPPLPTEREQWVVGVEGGLLAMRRELGYEGVSAGTGTLRGHEVPGMAGAFVRLDLFPAAAFTRGPLARAGLFASYARSVGVETKHPTSGAMVPTDLARLGAGVLWRTPPIGSPRIVLVPSVSWQSLELTLSPSIPGVPDARLSGLKGAVDVEVPLGARLVVLGGVGYVRWLRAKDLVEGTVSFFPGGSASAIEGEAGLGVLLGGVTVRVVAEASRTSYSLDADPSGTYAATGATDLYLGARLTAAVRY